MNIIIDGYNVIGTMHKSLQKAREEFIALMSEYSSISQHHITLVFDGTVELGFYSRLIKTSGITVIYSDGALKADDVIKDLICKDKRSWVVITSDTDIAKFAWANNAVPVKSHVFMQKVHKRLQAAKDIEMSFKDADLDEGPSPKQRGNPHKLSKKDRLLKSVTSKL